MKNIDFDRLAYKSFIAFVVIIFAGLVFKARTLFVAAEFIAAVIVVVLAFSLARDLYCWYKNQKTKNTLDETKTENNQNNTTNK
jgi:hypothetical protein